MKGRALYFPHLPTTSHTMVAGVGSSALGSSVDSSALGSSEALGSSAPGSSSGLARLQPSP